MSQLQRILETLRAKAVSKDIPKKVLTVAQELGDEVRHQGMHDWGDFDDCQVEVATTYLGLGANHSPTGIDVMDESEPSMVIGWNYDGLTSGYRLEARWMPGESEILARWHGRLVFKETAGEISCYVPGEWEDRLERLYAIAKGRKIDKREIANEARKQAADDEVRGLLGWLKEFWGYVPEQGDEGHQPPQPR